MDVSSSLTRHPVPVRRHRQRRRRWIAAWLLAGLAAAGSGQGPPQEASREADLEAIRGRVGELEARLSEIRHRKEGLVGDLVEADYELQLQLERLAEARNRLVGARDELTAAERDTAALEERLAAVRSAVSRRVVGLYRLGGRGPVRLALSVRATDDLLPALRSLRYLVRRDAELRRELNDTRAEMTAQLAVLRRRRADVEELVTLEAERLAEGRRLRQRRAALLAEVEKRERSVADERATLVDREGKLEDFLTQVVGGGEALAGRPIQDFRGVLDRPITGSVIRGFGPRRDPRYRTLVPHNGLQFAGLAEENVRVVYPGRVLYAEPLEGYGETVIVLHPGRVFSLYAGLEGIAVHRDELLSIGQVIGTAGSGLYFEIREENRPVDPAGWIR
jgi:murein hydrolase activator